MHNKQTSLFFPQQEHITILTHKAHFLLFKFKTHGLYFGLTKVLLAEGDAPFPLMRHRNISLRRTLLRKIMMRAQRERENSKKNKNKLNINQLSQSNNRHCESGFCPRSETQVSLILEFSHLKHACVLACAAMLLCALALTKSRPGNLCAVLSCKEMRCHHDKSSHARLRCLREGKAASPWSVAERN